ncbi:glycosyl transferase family 1 [Chryseobacterium lactis]|uniref:Glycosyl transferase family 1 n=1 Tax=Chryseobacterium lactis TaxID=1241981 RepID=A0A3G6RRD9_CHRLC|nr:glycosyltransferase [Chryseobacterium lactis]AZA81414.1 glycosyltransferase [Chryseobacterium lactis]AZB06413.1 glycosyltransferase [Chryseobacterium lactis]PNW15265.1 glycosyl transferase family 1 [Chryseobacterium lactis]
MKKKILTSAFSNLYTDQRIEKVCKTLFDNGYPVELIGNDWGGSEKMERPYPFSRIQIKSTSLKTAYFEFNWKLYHELKKKADKNTILHANDIDAILPNYLIAKKLNIPLVFDSHEIFTEMPAIQNRFSQKFWRVLEKSILPKIQFMMTESESYAEWFHEKYNVNAVVVRNIPRKLPPIEEVPDNNPKIILYQGAINQSRGIEKVILAMHHMKGAVLKIAGDGPRKKTYEDLVIQERLQDKVIFLGKLKPENLREVTKTADVGFSLEENNGVSYYYSLPNKVCDYIQARVPLVMINFPEMQRIKNQFDVGEMVTDHQPLTIEKAIHKILEKGRLYYKTELDKAADVFCWENEETKILQLFEKASGK